MTATTAGDRPAILAMIDHGARSRLTIGITGAEAAQLQAYIRQLELAMRDAADRQLEGTAGLRPPVLAFAWLMEGKLRKHDADRGARGWQDDRPEALRDRIGDELAEVTQALRQWTNPNSCEATARNTVANECADVGNFAMMVADVCGGLAGVGPGLPRKRARRLRQLHRMLERLQHLVERLTADGVTPHQRIVWLQHDLKAIEWALRQLDPQGEFRHALEADQARAVVAA